MKLRNKKTGEIREVREILIDGMFKVASLAELKEWEDVPEEPKEYWCIDWTGGINHITVLDDVDKYEENKKEIGNYFGTKKEAEKAVEKLKAWKRLKDNGFKFQFWTSSYSGDSISFFIDWITSDSKKEIEDDLDLLFGGEE